MENFPVNFYRAMNIIKDRCAGGGGGRTIMLAHLLQTQNCKVQNLLGLPDLHSEELGKDCFSIV